MVLAVSRVTTPVWRPDRTKRVVSALAYPVFWALNRPSTDWLSRAIYNFGLRCNGIAINFKGKHGLNIAEEKFLKRITKKLQGGVLFDVGANYGSYTSFLHHLAPTSTIYSFEPHPRTFAQLLARVKAPQVHAIQKALGDRDGTVQLYDFAESDGSTQASLSPDAVGMFDDNIISHDVTCTTLDCFLGQERIGRVDFLKIDTEGFDLSVLKGAKEAIEGKRIGIMQFEFIPANIGMHVTMRDFFEALPGYKIYRLCLNGGLVPIFPYDVKRCEIYVTHNLIALPA